MRAEGGVAERLSVVLESLNGDRPSEPPAMLAEVLRAPAAMRTALDAVLGDDAEAVIVESPHLALRAIDILKESRAGRLSFIPEPGPVDPHLAIEAPGIAGRLLDMIEVEPRFRHVAEAMLGHVVVADDLRAALAASNLNGHGTLFVTREGDLVSPGRIIAGGSIDATGDDAEERLTPEAPSLDEALAGVEQAESETASLRAAFEAARALLETVRRQLSEERDNLSRADRAASEQRSALERVESEIAAAAINTIRPACVWRK